jgi:hypothetical protein
MFMKYIRILKAIKQKSLLKISNVKDLIIIYFLIKLDNIYDFCLLFTDE